MRFELRLRGMPTPRSCTRTHTVSGDGAATATVTRTASLEYFTALSSRLVSDRAQLLGVAADDQRSLRRATRARSASAAR